MFLNYIEFLSFRTKMNLMERIAEFLEQNSELSIKQANEELKRINLVQEELPVVVRVGHLENGSCLFYTVGEKKETGETRPGLIFQEITKDYVAFQAPASPLTLPREIEDASLEGEQWKGRYGGHADAQLESMLKKQEQPLRDSGILKRDEYQLHHKRVFGNNPGFLIYHREPPAHDNSFAREMRYTISLGIPGYGMFENLGDYPEAKIKIPIAHVGIHILKFYYPAAPMARLNTPEQQDLFLEKVVNAVYQLPICCQHVEKVLGKGIAVPA